MNCLLNKKDMSQGIATRWVPKQPTLFRNTDTMETFRCPSQENEQENCGIVIQWNTTQN